MKHAYELDEANHNQLWADSIAKELAELQQYETFKVLRKGERPPPGYKFVPMHMIFSVKHDGRHKSRYVMNGSVTAPPMEDVYSPVVSLDTIRILLYIAVANGLSVRMADITCAYLQAKTREKIFYYSWT